MADKLLKRLSALVARLDQQHPPTEEVLFERQVRSVWGNLAIERPGLTIEEVRDVLRKSKE